MSNGSVSVAKVAQVLNLKNFTPDINLKKCKIISSDVNRPALQLTGYFEHFEESRIQMIGNVEYTFIQQMSDAEKKTRYDAFLKFDIPCVIFCRSLQPDEIFLEEAIKNEVPVLGTDRPTSEFMAELIYTLGEELAPCITVHGVLVDVYGEGLMITGDSGIGKSEAALELIRRGHRLVTDDVVEIRKINEHTLIGTSPEVTRHFIELRGIGIIDVKTLYGVECVKTISNTMEHANSDQASHFRLIKNNTPCLYFLMTESNAALNALRKRAAKLFFWVPSSLM